MKASKLIQGLFLLIYLATFIACSAEQPKVVSSVPSPGQSGVDKSQRISVHFSKEMNRERCVAAFQIQPALRGYFTGGGDSITFTSSEPLESGSTYIFSVSPDCEDKDGRDLIEPYVASFAVGNELTPPRVLKASARQNQSGCLDADPWIDIADFENKVYHESDFCASSNILVQFSEAMERSSVEGSFSANPPLNGSFIWSEDERQFEFNPMSALYNGVTYVFSIAQEARDLSENKLEGAVSFSLTVGSDFNSPQVCLGSLIGGSPLSLCGASDNGINLPPQGDIGTSCSGNTNGSIVAANTSCRTTLMRIQFSEDMNIGKTVSALAISPSIAYTTFWQDSDSNAKGDLLVIQPSQAMKNNTYTVTINSSAEDLAGNMMAKPFTFSFAIPHSGDVVLPLLIAGNEVTGDLVACNGQGSNVIADFQSGVCYQRNGLVLHFHFSEDMNQAQTAQALSFSPTISGSISWMGTAPGEPGASTMIFTPSEDLARDKQYTITVRNSAEDTQGNPLPENFVRYFSTTGDGLAPSLVQNNEVLVARAICDGSPDTVLTDFMQDVCYLKDQVIFRINFNEAMDTSATSAAISFTPAINGAFSWIGNNLTFTPLEDLKINTQYRLTISTNARDLSGNRLENEFARFFNTVAGDNASPMVSAVLTDRTSGAGGCDANGDDDLMASVTQTQDVCVDNMATGKGARLRLIFNEAMDTNSVLNAFAISPDLGGTKILQNGNRELLFTADEVLAPGALYRISLSAGAKDASLNSLNKELILFFETSAINGYPEISSINLLSGNSTFPVCDNINTDLVTALPVVNQVCEADALGQVYPITVVFSEPMNQTKTADAFSLEPPSSGNINWTAANAMEFYPKQKLLYGSRYQLSFATSTEDLQGHKLQDKYEVSFIVGMEDTVPPLVSDIAVNFEKMDTDGCLFQPNGTLTRIQSEVYEANDHVCLNQPIVINFDRLAKGNVFMAPLATQNAIYLTPALNLAFSWDATFTNLSLLPLESLDSDKKYLLTIGANAQDYAGNKMEIEFIAGFKTEDTSPQVLAMGLESQTQCNLMEYPIGPNGASSASATCWWRSGQSILSANNYTFRGDYRDSAPPASCADQTSDNLTIIFNRDMEPFSTVDAVSMQRVSLPASSVKIVSWQWDDMAHPRMLTLQVAESLSTACDNNQSSFTGTNPESNLAGSTGMYLIQVDTTAKDLNGNNLTRQFNFSVIGEP